MLQQTQVSAVVPYYQRFLKQFPNLKALARAPLDDVLALWSGLGYYSRARNLHRAAQIIVTEHRGQFPTAYDDVLALPGIGRSTAAAISAFAFGERRAILDGNVKRVFARCFGIAEWTGLPKVEEKLWQCAESLLPNKKNEKDIEVYTQGLMDLGATICTRSKPRCAECPLNKECVALKKNLVHKMPASRPRKALPQKSTCMLVLLHQGKVLLEKRPPRGIWGGLWSLPEVGKMPAFGDMCHGFKIAGILEMPALAHTFTHFKLDINPYRCEVVRLSKKENTDSVIWLSLVEALNAGIPTPVRTILQMLET